VPLVAVPGHVVDQADNAVKAARRGFCIPVYLGRNFSTDALHGALLRVLTEPGFRAAAARVAARMRARRRSPAEEAVGAGQPRTWACGMLALSVLHALASEHALQRLACGRGVRCGCISHAPAETHADLQDDHRSCAHALGCWDHHGGRRTTGAPRGPPRAARPTPPPCAARMRAR